MDQNEHPLEPHHLGVRSATSKTISKPMVCLVQIMHLSCTDANIISKWTEMRFQMTHVTSEFHRVHPKRFMSPWYNQRKWSNYLASRLALSPNKPKRASTWALWLWSPSGAFKMISEPMVRLAQTVHQSCTDTNTVSKWTKTRFHMNHIT
jgi:hypothetical protein